MRDIYSPCLYHFRTTKELLDLIPMKGTTTGEDFMIIFEETLENMICSGIKWLQLQLISLVAD